MTPTEREEIKRLEHMEKLCRLHQFLHQIRYPDITAGYMNRFINII